MLEMEGFYRCLVSKILLSLVIQLIIPAFLSVTDADFVPSDHQTFHAEQHSLNTPLLIKEIDETEGRLDDFTAVLVKLIDFTEHSAVLSRYHDTRITPLTYHEHYDSSPPIFALNGLLLI
jgi:hypothetical protein